MKVLQVVHRFPPERLAGTELYTLAISRGLLQRGHQCSVLAGSGRASPGGALTSEVEDGIHVTRMASSIQRAEGWFPAYDPEIDERVRGYLGELKPDVIHIQHWVTLTANLIALCHEMDYPTVVTLHDLAVICPKMDRIRFDKVFCTDPLATAPCLICVQRQPWQGDDEVHEELTLRQQMIEQGLGLADYLIVPSVAQKEFLAKFLDTKADRLEVLPHGTPRELKRVSAPENATVRRPLRLGHWGHLMWPKGPHLLLEAVGKLSDPGAVEVHLLGEAGDRSYREELQALARGLPVTFHGAFTAEDLERLELDVAIFPSLCHESHSFVLDEAFQLGLPVIVSDRGAMAERVGPAGLVFSAGVVEDLAEKIQKLLGEPALLERLRKATPRDPPHPMSEHILSLERIYGKVIKSRRKRSVPRPDYLKILILRQQELANREGAIAQEQVRNQQLQAEAQDYQDHLHRDLERAKAEYQHLHTEAQQYQGRLERDLAQAQADYQRLHAQAQAEYQQLHAQAEEYRAQLERQLAQALVEYRQLDTELRQEIRRISEERDQLRKAVEWHLSHRAVRLYLRAWKALLGSPDER